MRTIWKQDISEDHHQEFMWPSGARIVYSEIQNGRPRVWFLCDPDAPVMKRTFKFLPTGVPMEDHLVYRASFMLYGGEILAHLMEEPG